MDRCALKSLEFWHVSEMFLTLGAVIQLIPAIWDYYHKSVRKGHKIFLTSHDLPLQQTEIHSVALGPLYRLGQQQNSRQQCAHDAALAFEVKMPAESVRKNL